MLNEQAAHLMMEEYLGTLTPSTKFGATLTGVSLRDSVWNVLQGVKANGFGWLEILKQLPAIVAALQELGPEIEKVVAIISRLLDSFKPSPIPPVVKP